jgi:regulator of sigma E protease
MNIVVTIVAFLVALGVLIVFHELGHYSLARAFRVKVLRFSIGFGRALWTFRSGPDRTEWVIAAIPLGGYVKMLDEREGPVAPEEAHRAFNRQSVWRRIAIVAAGPIANFLLAIVFYWMLFVGGVQEAKPIVGAPQAGTAAEAAGVQRGETILKINGEAVTTWQQVRWRLLQLVVEKQPAQLEVIDAKQHLAVRTLDLSGLGLEGFESDPLARVGIRLDWPDTEPVVGDVLPGDVAESAGLRSGDRIVSIDGREMRLWEDVVKAVRSSPGEDIRLVVLRGGERLEITLRPAAVRENGERFGRIGAGTRVDPEWKKSHFVLVHYGPIAALGKALERTWDTSVFSLRMLGKMLIGEVSWKNLSGPVTIADYAGQSAQLGIGAYIAFLALISISLGVLNLLPIPLLDGGHLLYYVVEIFKGSPVSERVMELGQRVGLTLLLFLMAFAIYNDFNRLLTG